MTWSRKQCPSSSRHNLGTLSGKALNLASLPGAKTARYVNNPLTKLRYGLPGGWQEILRYRSPGEITNAKAAAWVTEARRLVDDIVATMRLDGVIKA